MTRRRLLGILFTLALGGMVSAQQVNLAQLIGDQHAPMIDGHEARWFHKAVGDEFEGRFPVRRAGDAGAEERHKHESNEMKFGVHGCGV